MKLDDFANGPILRMGTWAKNGFSNIGGRISALRGGIGAAGSWISTKFGGGWTEAGARAGGPVILAFGLGALDEASNNWIEYNRDYHNYKKMKNNRPSYLFRVHNLYWTGHWESDEYYDSFQWEGTSGSW